MDRPPRAPHGRLDRRPLIALAATSREAIENAALGAARELAGEARLCPPARLPADGEAAYPLRSRGEEHGMLVVTGVQTRELRRAMQALTAQVSLALESAALTEEVHQRAADRRHAVRPPGRACRPRPAGERPRRRLRGSADCATATARRASSRSSSPTCATTSTSAASCSTAATSATTPATRCSRRPRSGSPPDQFIGLAEEMGLIVPLGTYVLNQACRQAVALRPSR